MENRHHKIKIEFAQEINDGSELIDINCYDYLLQVANHIPDNLTDGKYQLFIDLKNFFKNNPTFLPGHPYSNQYTDFLLKLENIIESILDNHNSPDTIYNVIYSIYANPNQCLERTEKMIEEVIESAWYQSVSIEHAIAERILGKGETTLEKAKNHLNYYIYNFNKNTPQQEGSFFNRFTSMISQNYKPQTTTGIASIRQYAYKMHAEKKYPEEYRFPTQGQYHHGSPRVSPLFKAWLHIQQTRETNQPLDLDKNKQITHIYFNNLALDRSLLDYEGTWEKSLTEELHKLEDSFNNIAVITLPAHKGLFDLNLLENHTQNIDYYQAYERMLNIAIGASKEPIQDFHISNKIKKILYGATGDTYNTKIEVTTLRNLLKNSFDTLGIKNNQLLSSLDCQAVYFHFIKFELTNFIIETLQPISFNMSCKHGCDRGGIASAYYNLIKSLVDHCPMKKQEFNRALHAAPALTNGRGMNHHINILWNAIDAYINSQVKCNENNIPLWLKEWRKKNAPSYSKQYYINQLESYIRQRIIYPHRYYSPLGYVTGYPSEIKIEIAKKVLALLKEEDTGNINISSEEMGALRNDNLGTIYADIEKYHFINLQEHTLKRRYSAQF